MRAEEFMRLIESSGNARWWDMWQLRKAGAKLGDLAQAHGVTRDRVSQKMAKMKRWESRLNEWIERDSLASLLGMGTSAVQLAKPS